MATKKKTSDAVEILHRRHFQDKSDRLAELEIERTNAEVARELYALRTESGLSQQELAKLIGTSASVICRLEDADYEGRSLTMLQRIATALKQRLEVRFVPIRQKAGAV